MSVKQKVLWKTNQQFNTNEKPQHNSEHKILNSMNVTLFLLL